jgi:hypothetical protein
MTVAFPAGGFASAMLIAALPQGELMWLAPCIAGLCMNCSMLLQNAH